MIGMSLLLELEASEPTPGIRGTRATVQAPRPRNPNLPSFIKTSLSIPTCRLCPSWKAQNLSQLSSQPLRCVHAENPLDPSPRSSTNCRNARGVSDIIQARVSGWSHCAVSVALSRSCSRDNPPRLYPHVNLDPSSTHDANEDRL